MGDIQLNHQSVDNAVASMQQSTQTMINHMDQLVQGLQSMSSTFTGAAADAWHQFQTAANQAANAMNNDFGKGSVVLADMHNIHKSADQKGASIFGG
jgi:uncharacterized protein YukE